MSNFTTWRSLVDGEEILAIPDSVVEDFERTNPLDDYFGDVGDFDVVDSDPIEGDKTLETDRGAGQEIISTSGLSDYPQRGDVFSCLIMATDSRGGPEVIFGASDVDNFYDVRTEPGSDNIRLAVTEGGSRTTLDSASPSLDVGEVYDVGITWSENNDIDVSLYDWDETEFERGSALASLSANDDTHASESGIGFRTAGNDGQDPNRWDWYVIRDKGGA